MGDRSEIAGVDMASDAILPPEARPRAFAGTELLLDLIYTARSVIDVDLESLVIFLCVNEATVRAFLLDPKTPPDVLTMVEPPESYRGSISRLLVADRTGLPRETVRRKIKKLVAAGVLIEGTGGGVRSARNLGQGHIRKASDDAFAAVQRYNQRLKGLGCKAPCDP